MRLTACLAWTALALGVAPALADKRVALVIGNAAYRHMPALTNPGRDANEMAASLRRLGFETTVLADVDRIALNDGFKQFARNAGGADIVFVFYSGHGAELEGRNWLMPVDARLDAKDDVNDADLLALDRVTSALRDKGKIRIVVLDACRDNPAANALKRRIAEAQGHKGAGLSKGLGRALAADGELIVFATQSGEVAVDGGGATSPFTASLLRHIETPDLDVRQMFFRVQTEVARATAAGAGADKRQLPEVANSIIGEEFKLKSAALAASDPTARPAPPPPPAPPAPDPAAQAWAATQATASIAVLEAFIGQYGQTFYGTLARARLDELNRAKAEELRKTEELRRAEELKRAEDLRKNQIALAAPPPPAAEQIARTARPRGPRERCASRAVAAGTDLYCVSSVLDSQLGNSYGVANLFNGNSSTAWVEGVSGQGLGEWIAVEFNGLRLVRSVTVNNGYQKNSDIFHKNGRVRRLRLVFSQGESFTFTLRDGFGAQTLPLDRPVKAFWMQAVIDDVYPGHKYSDTAISKLAVASEHAR